MKAERENLEQRILRAVQDCGLSITELAKVAGVPQPVLWRFANGQRGITLATASKLAKALGLELVERRKGR